MTAGRGESRENGATEPSRMPKDGSPPVFTASVIRRRVANGDARKRYTVTISAAPRTGPAAGRNTSGSAGANGGPAADGANGAQKDLARTGALHGDPTRAPDDQLAGAPTADADTNDEGLSLFAELADPEFDGEASRPARRPKPPQPGSRPPNVSPRPARRRRWPLALAVLAFALSVGIPIFLRARSTDSPNGRTANPAAASAPVVVRPSSTGSDPRSPARAALVAWAQRSLSPEAVIVSDSATVSQLRGAGFTSSLSFDDVGSRPVQTVDYVFDIPGAVPSALPAARARAKLIRLSLPLATFSAARSAPTARQVFPDGTAPVQRRQASSEEVQRIAGRELLQNPAVVPDAATKTALQNGDLDLRAETVLSDLATTDLVYVTDPVTNAAEARAGRPIRSVVVTTSDSQAAQSVLSSMVSPYRPDTVQSISPRKLRLSWQPAIGLATTVGQ